MAPTETPRLTEGRLAEIKCLAETPSTSSLYGSPDVRALIAEIEWLRRTGLALAWSDGWQAAFDRPADAEAAIKFRDLKHYRDVQAIIDGTTTE